MPTGELMDVVYRYYPRGVACSDPRYDASEERLRLKEARREAAERRGPWRALLQRLRERFPGIELRDNVVLCPAEALDSGYSCYVQLPEHRLVLVMSFLVPRYVIYTDRQVQEPEPAPSPQSDEVDIYIGDTMYVVPAKAVTPGLRDALRDEADARLLANPELAALLAEVQSRPSTRREISFDLSPEDQPYAAEMGREMGVAFGYELMPPEVGREIVPDVETGAQVFGEATLYDCLLSDGYW